MNLNILIIHQDDVLCRELSRFLMSAGHRTTCDAYGVYALEKATQLRPDLIIIEIARAELPAIETIKSLRLLRSSLGKHISVIVISDFPSYEFELLHISDFICKPVKLERLSESIATLAGGGNKKRIRTENATLSVEEFKVFQEYLLANSGLYFGRHNNKILERGLGKRMTALRINSYNDYHEYLTESSERRNELQKLLQFITVGESFFFRQQGHFNALIKKLLPEIIAVSGGNKIRIWSAGCSTGEEAYSLAMAVMEAVPDWKSHDVRILGSDINSHSLMRAVEGGYSRWKVRVTEKKYLDEYFNLTGESYVVKDEVKSLVDFIHSDLGAVHSSPDRLMPESCDVIFCRNVMIYFTKATTTKIVESFAAALKPGGYLFLGHSETLAQISPKFERQLDNGVFFYRRRSESQPAMDKQHPVVALAGKNDRLHIPAETVTPRLTVTMPLCPEGSFNLDALYAAAIARKQEKSYVLAKNLFRQILDRDPDHKDAILGEAIILAYSGHFDEALEKCTRALLLDDLLPGAYFLKGYVYDLTDRRKEAIDEYRKAILLNMDFIMPHYRLGKLYWRNGQHDVGKRALKNSLKLLERGGGEAIIPCSGGLSRALFLEQLRDEIVRIDAAMAT